VSRHNLLRDAVHRFCSRAQMSASLEQGASGSNMERPADVLVQGFSLNTAAAIDVTVVSPFALSNLGAGNLGGVHGAVARAEAKKMAENGPKCRELGWKCSPFGVDTFGCWGNSARSVIDTIAGRLAVQTRVPRALAARSVFGCLGLVLMRQNARAILARRPLSDYGAREARLVFPADDDLLQR